MTDNVGLKIKKYLDDNGISLAFISNNTGIGYYKLVHYLSGKYSKFPLEYYTKICDVLKLNYNYFLKKETK